MSNETKLSEYEKCQYIRRVILNRAASVMNYNWDAEFSTSQIKEIPEITKKYSVDTVDISQLTENQMIELGFGKWSEDNPMFLIPLWLFPWLSEEIKTNDITGDSVLKKSEMDTDQRFGCLAYGIYPAK